MQACGPALVSFPTAVVRMVLRDINVQQKLPSSRTLMSPVADQKLRRALNKSAHEDDMQITMDVNMRKEEALQAREINKDGPPQVLHTPAPVELSFQRLLSKNREINPFAFACNLVDALVNAFLGNGDLPSSANPAVQLAGNSFPVPETPPTPCTHVCGTIPADLEGVYVRNGPNPATLHNREGYHLFDGDGMLHALRLKRGRASFCTRYVRTSRFLQELSARRPLFPKFIGGLRGAYGAARIIVLAARVAFGLLDVTRGWGLSNTSVVFFDNKLLSLSEDDMPYIIHVTRSGDLLTQGRYSFRQPHASIVPKINMCAHPKIDPWTGEMMAFSITPFLPPFSVFRASRKGAISPDLPIPLLDVPLVHDFAITRKYIVFPDSQLVLRPLEFFNGKMPVVCDKNKVPRIGLFPRYGDSAQDMAKNGVWFNVPGVNCMHYVNAWEEGDEIVIVAPIVNPVEYILDMPVANVSCTVSIIRLNTSTGASSHRALCEGNYEFGTINPQFVGNKTRYAYFLSGSFPAMSGVVKVDLQAPPTKDAVLARREFGKSCFGSEPFFVAKRSSGGKVRGAEEDDGYVLCYVHNESTGVSELFIMDARSCTLGILAKVGLPSRVPYGFHGCFVSEDQLSLQFPLFNRN